MNVHLNTFISIAITIRSRQNVAQVKQLCINMSNRHFPFCVSCFVCSCQHWRISLKGVEKVCNNNLFTSLKEKSVKGKFCDSYLACLECVFLFV